MSKFSQKFKNLYQWGDKVPESIRKATTTLRRYKGGSESLDQTFQSDVFSDEMSDNVDKSRQSEEINRARTSTLRQGTLSPLFSRPLASEMSYIEPNMDQETIDPWPNSNRLHREDLEESENHTTIGPDELSEIEVDHSAPRESSQPGPSSQRDSGEEDRQEGNPSRHSLRPTKKTSGPNSDDGNNSQPQYGFSREISPDGSVVSRTSTNSRTSGVVNTYRKDFYESLTLLTQKHNNMLEQYVQQQLVTQRLSQEMESLRRAQQEHFLGVQSQIKQQEDLQRATNDKASKLEENMIALSTHVIDLRKDMDQSSKDSTSHQREVASTMSTMVQELKQMRIDINQRPEPVKVERPTTVVHRRTKDPPPPMTLPVKQSASIQGKSQTYGYHRTRCGANVSNRNSVGIDPRTLSSPNDSDQQESEPMDQDPQPAPTKSESYHTACDKSLTGFTTALDSTKGAFEMPSRTTRLPRATSTKKRFRLEEGYESDNGLECLKADKLDEKPEAATKLSPEELRDKRLAESISEAMAKGLELLIANKDARSRPSVYKGSKDWTYRWMDIDDATLFAEDVCYGYIFGSSLAYH